MCGERMDKTVDLKKGKTKKHSNVAQLGSAESPPEVGDNEIQGKPFLHSWATVLFSSKGHPGGADPEETGSIHGKGLERELRILYKGVNIMTNREI